MRRLPLARLAPIAVAVAAAAAAAAAACKPGGVTATDELCARAAAKYEKCESRDGMTPQQWELGLDRWRGLCRAAFTGETRQLLPDGLALWEQMADEARRGLREQASCAADAADCARYAACDN
jgi:hypothetical protein